MFILSRTWLAKFGMLIEFLFEQFPQWEDEHEIPIQDLEQSKKRFDDDSQFKERAQKAVVSLQGGDPKYRKAWTRICEISHREFQKVYQRLGVHLEEKAARRAGWLSADDKLHPRVSHVGFGLVLGDDGKRFRTRSSEVVRLVICLMKLKIEVKLMSGLQRNWSKLRMQLVTGCECFGGREKLQSICSIMHMLEFAQ